MSRKNQAQSGASSAPLFMNEDFFNISPAAPKNETSVVKPEGRKLNSRRVLDDSDDDDQLPSSQVTTLSSANANEDDISSLFSSLSLKNAESADDIASLTTHPLPKQVELSFGNDTNGSRKPRAGRSIKAPRPEALHSPPRYTYTAATTLSAYSNDAVDDLADSSISSKDGRKKLASRQIASPPHSSSSSLFSSNANTRTSSSSMSSTSFFPPTSSSLLLDALKEEDNRNSDTKRTSRTSRAAVATTTNTHTNITSINTAGMGNGKGIRASSGLFSSSSLLNSTYAPLSTSTLGSKTMSDTSNGKYVPSQSLLSSSSSLVSTTIGKKNSSTTTSRFSSFDILSTHDDKNDKALEIATKTDACTIGKDQITDEESKKKAKAYDSNGKNNDPKSRKISGKDTKTSSSTSSNSLFSTIPSSLSPALSSLPPLVQQYYEQCMTLASVLEKGARMRLKLEAELEEQRREARAHERKMSKLSKKSMTNSSSLTTTQRKSVKDDTKSRFSSMYDDESDDDDVKNGNSDVDDSEDEYCEEDENDEDEDEDEEENEDILNAQELLDSGIHDDISQICASITLPLSLRFYSRAYDILPNDILHTKIKKLREACDKNNFSWSIFALEPVNARGDVDRYGFIRDKQWIWTQAVNISQEIAQRCAREKAKAKENREKQGLLDFNKKSGSEFTSADVSVNVDVIPSYMAPLPPQGSISSTFLASLHSASTSTSTSSSASFISCPSTMTLGMAGIDTVLIDLLGVRGALPALWLRGLTSRIEAKRAASGAENRNRGDVGDSDRQVICTAPTSTAAAVSACVGSQEAAWYDLVLLAETLCRHPRGKESFSGTLLCKNLISGDFCFVDTKKLTASGKTWDFETAIAKVMGVHGKNFRISVSGIDASSGKSGSRTNSQVLEGSLQAIISKSITTIPQMHNYLSKSSRSFSRTMPNAISNTSDDIDALERQRVHEGALRASVMALHAVFTTLCDTMRAHGPNSVSAASASSSAATLAAGTTTGAGTSDVGVGEGVDTSPFMHGHIPLSVLNALCLPSLSDSLADHTLVMPAKTFLAIYPYQRQCVCWLWSLHTHTHRGGILGDDMGLGKTVQLCAFIRALHYSRHSKRILLVAPVSVLEQWNQELNKWCPDVPVTRLHTQTALSSRVQAVSSVVRGGGVLLTTYGMVSNNIHVLALDQDTLDAEIHGPAADGDASASSSGAGAGKPKKRTQADLKALTTLENLVSSGKQWDYVIMDEGHRLKNPEIALSQCARKIRTRRRVLLTGTPIQNDLDEVWALFDFACFGRLLGERRMFNVEFGHVIRNGNVRNASPEQQKEAMLAGVALRQLIHPHFLRRDKNAVHGAAALKVGGASNMILPNSHQDVGDYSEYVSTGIDTALSHPLSQQWTFLWTSRYNGENATGGKDGVFSTPAFNNAAAAAAAHADAEMTGSDENDGAVHAQDNDHQDGMKPAEDKEIPDSEKSKKSESTGKTLPSLANIQKNELILWVYLSPMQRSIYRSFVADPRVQELLMSSKSPLAALTVLKSLCDHPRLLAGRGHDGEVDSEEEEKGMVEEEEERYGYEDDDVMDTCVSKSEKRTQMKQKSKNTKVAQTTKAILEALKAYSTVKNIDEDENTFDEEYYAYKRSSRYQAMVDASSTSNGGVAVPSFGSFGHWEQSLVDLVMESGKLRVLVELLGCLKVEGHRVLIFSQSKRMLDMIERILASPAFSSQWRRIDGDVKAVERQRRIEEFNRSNDIFAFLLTTKAGGEGVNLTGADRVIIFDPHWNPSADAQAVDRAYRLGQRKNVVIYKLITCGTIEEVIYRKQVFKKALINSTLTDNRRFAQKYFTKAELDEVLRLVSPLYSRTQTDLAVLHPSSMRKTYLELEKHVFLLEKGNLAKVTYDSERMKQRISWYQHHHPFFRTSNADGDDNARNSSKSLPSRENNHGNQRMTLPQGVIFRVDDRIPVTLFGFRIFGISDNDLLYSQENSEHTATVEEDEASSATIEGKKQKLLQSGVISRTQSRIPETEGTRASCNGGGGQGSGLSLGSGSSNNNSEHGGRGGFNKRDRYDLSDMMKSARVSGGISSHSVSGELKHQGHHTQEDEDMSDDDDVDSSRVGMSLAEHVARVNLTSVHDEEDHPSSHAGKKDKRTSMGMSATSTVRGSMYEEEVEDGHTYTEQVRADASEEDEMSYVKEGSIGQGTHRNRLLNSSDDEGDSVPSIQTKDKERKKPKRVIDDDTPMHTPENHSTRSYTTFSGPPMSSGRKKLDESSDSESEIVNISRNAGHSTVSSPMYVKSGTGVSSRESITSPLRPRDLIDEYSRDISDMSTYNSPNNHLNHSSRYDNYHDESVYTDNGDTCNLINASMNSSYEDGSMDNVVPSDNTSVCALTAAMAGMCMRDDDNASEEERSKVVDVEEEEDEDEIEEDEDVEEEEEEDVEDGNAAMDDNNDDDAVDDEDDQDEDEDEDDVEEDVEEEAVDVRVVGTKSTLSTTNRADTHTIVSPLHHKVVSASTNTHTHTSTNTNNKTVINTSADALSSLLNSFPVASPVPAQEASKKPRRLSDHVNVSEATHGNIGSSLRGAGSRSGNGKDNGSFSGNANVGGSVDGNVAAAKASLGAAVQELTRSPLYKQHQITSTCNTSAGSGNSAGVSADAGSGVLSQYSTAQAAACCGVETGEFLSWSSTARAQALTRTAADKVKTVVHALQKALAKAHEAAASRGKHVRVRESAVMGKMLGKEKVRGVLCDAIRCVEIASSVCVGSSGSNGKKQKKENSAVYAIIPELVDVVEALRSILRNSEQE